MIKFFAPTLIALAILAAVLFGGIDYGEKKERVKWQNKEIVNQNQNANKSKN